MLLKSLSPQYFKKLRIKYALALSFIAFVLLSSYFIIQMTIKQNYHDSRVVNIAGRQRMLSQKISKTALLIQVAKDKVMISQSVTELNEAVNLWTRSQAALQFGDPNMGIPRRQLSAEIINHFDEVKPFFLKIVSAAENISAAVVRDDLPSEAKQDIINYNTATILSNEKSFLPIMDEITFIFDKEANLKVIKLKQMENMLLITGFLVLLFEFFFIFRPSTKEMTKAVGNIIEQRSQLKVANDALATALDESKRLEKLAQSASEAKSTFLANMSHEIRTPMNSILGFAEILDGKISDPVHKHYLSNMMSSGKILLALINDILDLSKIEAGKLSLNPKSVNLHKITTEIADTFRYMAEEKGLDFSFVIEDDIPHGVVMDEIRLRQVLFNLLGNAVKFTERGYISLHVSVHGFSEKLSKYNLLFEIEDTGIGIPESAANKIFDAFEQQSKQDHRKYGGTGLGLSITQKLIKLMNGDIWVESALQRGSKFSFRLDDIPVASMMPDEAPLNLKYKFKPAKIIIADDIPVNIELLKEYLSAQPFEIYPASNGLDVIGLADKHKIDLILSDLRMPEMDGMEMASKLRSFEKTKHTKIIAITASSMNITPAEITDLFDGYLEKPLTSYKLFKELSKHLPTEKKLNEAIETAESDYDFNILNKEETEKMLNVFTDSFMMNMREQIDILSYEEIESIINHVRVTAEKYNSPPLLKWCTEASEAMSIFDMEKLEKILSQFEEIISKIKERL